MAARILAQDLDWRLKRPARMLARLVLVATIALCACGETLADSSYRGEPLLSIDGLVSQGLEYASTDNFRISVFWSRESRTTTVAEELIEQPNVSVAVDFPAKFRLNIFEPPIGVSIHDPPTPFLVGFLIAYDDIDHDGRLSPGERRGVAGATAILYAEAPVDATASWTGKPLSAGYSAVTLPLPCGPVEASRPSIKRQCGTPIGAACASDVDCGPLGQCIIGSHTFYGEFANGYCILPVHESPTCTPEQAEWLDLTDDNSPDGILDAWFLRCESDDDCRSSEGYECFAPDRACMPKQPILLFFGAELDILPLCRPSDGR